MQFSKNYYENEVYNIRFRDFPQQFEGYYFDLKKNLIDVCSSLK